MSISFLLTALVIVITPGTGVLYVIATGVSRGVRASALASVACTLGIIPHLVAAVSGLAAVLAASPTAFEVVRWLGVGYLLYMAVMTWRDRSRLDADPNLTRRTGRQVMRDGIVLNLLNPKLTTFFFAFLPQFVVPGSSHAALRMLLLGLVFMVMTLVVFVGYGLMASFVRERVLDRPAVVQWMRRVFAATFVALGVRLALG